MLPCRIQSHDATSTELHLLIKTYFDGNNEAAGVKTRTLMFGTMAILKMKKNYHKSARKSTVTDAPTTFDIKSLLAFALQ